MDGSHWVGSVSIPLEFMSDLQVYPFEEIALKYPADTNHDDANEQKNLVIVKVVPLMNSSSFSGHPKIKPPISDVPIVRLHPLVEEFLVSIAESASGSNDVAAVRKKDENIRIEGDTKSIEIQHAYWKSYKTACIIKKRFEIEKLSPSCQNVLEGDNYGLDVTLRLCISSSDEYQTLLQNLGMTACIASNEEGGGEEDHVLKPYVYRCIKQELVGRTMQKGIYFPVALPPLPNMPTHSGLGEVAIFQIASIQMNSSEIPKNANGNISDFRIETCDSLSSLTILPEEQEHEEIMPTAAIQMDSTTCPGYETLVKEVVSISQIEIHCASPTGVILTGCTGVGKTRLATAVIDELFISSSRQDLDRHESKILSSKEILLEASSSSTMDLGNLKRFVLSHVMSSKKGQRVLVIDDLDTVLGHDDETSSMDNEKRIAFHAITSIFDDLNYFRGEGTDRHRLPSFILGICCDESSTIPPTLARVGRFEKIVTMSPPTEKQRQDMLYDMLIDLNINIFDDTTKEQCSQRWSSAVAPHTAGCVAADLRRICVDAITRSKARSQRLKSATTSLLWEDIREATRACVPSQLAQLDVSLTRNFEKDVEIGLKKNKISPREKFFRTWAQFGGYQETKRRIFRTIVWPWERHHSDHADLGRPISSLEKEVPPPKGVLFYGPSGTGKTFAAECLAMSMGLNVVRVRASDVLDKWLGGSEAAIRSIFSRARAASPCILFFDELDSIATNREDDDGDSTDVHSRLLSTLLNEMDGVSSDRSKNDVLVVGTTNRLEAIDAALLRPGRFEAHIVLERPSINDIHEMMQIYLQKVPISNSVALHDTAELMYELEATAADVKGICSESCLHAIDHTDISTDEGVTLKGKNIDFAIRSWKR